MINLSASIGHFPVIKQKLKNQKTVSKSFDI